MHKVADWIKAGKLGELVWAQGSYCRNNAKSEWTFKPDEDASEQNIDWKRWQGKAKKMAFDLEPLF